MQGRHFPGRYNNHFLWDTRGKYQFCLMVPFTFVSASQYVLATGSLMGFPCLLQNQSVMFFVHRQGFDIQYSNRHRIPMDDLEDISVDI